jgi:hypothetical protein
MSNIQTPYSRPTPTGNPKADAKAAKAYAKASRPWYLKKRYWLLAVIGIAVIAAMVSGGDAQNGTTNGANGTANSRGGSDANADSAKATMKVEAKSILKEFEENEAAADAKYKGQVLEVAGVVDGVDTDFIDDEKYIVQVGAGSNFEIIFVNCNDQSQSDVVSIKKGQDITVVGDFYDGGDLGVELRNCVIR